MRNFKNIIRISPRLSVYKELDFVFEKSVNTVQSYVFYILTVDNYSFH